MSKYEKESLLFHSQGKRPGKISLKPTKPLFTQHDLSLAYSPGVAGPCREIVKDPTLAYKYTSKGNYVAIISNGTAVLGLGNIGAMASKPVMEGKAVLFKKFSDIDAIDIEVKETDPDKFIEIVASIADTWGGINLEDIKSPECFKIENELRKRLNIPVFHDDQHGTAITVTAGVMNAAEITGRKVKDMNIVINGPGAAGIACGKLLCLIGADPAKMIYCDQTGVLYEGRHKVTEVKKQLLIDTSKRTLQDAVVGADLFLGLSVKGALNPEWVKTMADNPIIFAMANPDPEITPEDALKVRPDAIIATGRSDYGNQINNVMGFPYIFRGALDVKAKEINEEMKIAAAKSIAALAKEPVPDEVKLAYGSKSIAYGKEYIIPTPFDPRLLPKVSVAVAKAAMDTGVAMSPIKDLEKYEHELSNSRDPARSILSQIMSIASSKKNKKKIIFAEGEEEAVILAATQLRNSKLAIPILIGDKRKTEAAMDRLGLKDRTGIEILNAAINDCNQELIEYMYKRMQRKGMLMRDCIRAVKTDRNAFAACLLGIGKGDALLTGLTRSYEASVQDIIKITEDFAESAFGIEIMVMENKTLLIADTAVQDNPDAEKLARMAEITAQAAKRIGLCPRVAFIASKNFSDCKSDEIQRIHSALNILGNKNCDFESDGPMELDIALDFSRIKTTYPFCRLTDAANIIIIPNMTAVKTMVDALQEFTECSIIGPILAGTNKSIQILHQNAMSCDIVYAAAWAVSDQS